MHRHGSSCDAAFRECGLWVPCWHGVGALIGPVSISFGRCGRGRRITSRGGGVDNMNLELPGCDIEYSSDDLIIKSVI